MKKILITTAMVALSAILGRAQGTVTIANSAAGYLISTNGSAMGLGTGAAGTGANSYYYAVLFSSYGGETPTANITTSSGLAQWTFSGVQAANNALTKGGIGNPSSTAVNGWAAPTGASYGTGTTEYYMIVGWSANEGTTWAQVANLINTTGLIAGGYFGTSEVAYNVAGGGPNSLPAVNLLNAPSQTGLVGSGMNGGFQLFAVTPEPGTMALAGLGIASLLALRRKK